jgi:hypothetical protein
MRLDDADAVRINDRDAADAIGRRVDELVGDRDVVCVGSITQLRPIAAASRPAVGAWRRRHDPNAAHAQLAGKHMRRPAVIGGADASNGGVVRAVHRADPWLRVARATFKQAESRRDRVNEV